MKGRDGNAQDSTAGPRSDAVVSVISIDGSEATAQ
jgi:hypothetical protein